MDYIVYLAIYNTTDRKLIVSMVEDALKIARLYKNMDIIFHYEDMLKRVKDIKQYKFMKDEADRIVYENSQRILKRRELNGNQHKAF